MSATLQLEEQERTAASVFNERHHLLRSLPSELISQIFETVKDNIPSFVSLEPCFRLAHICTAWRQIAFDTPRLWADVAFDMDIKEQSSRRDRSSILSLRASIFEDAISRSSALPIAIRITTRSPNWHTQDKALWIQVVEAIRRCLNRVHTLHLVVPYHLLHPFSGAVAPALRCLTLKALWGYRRATDVRQPVNLELLTQQVERLTLEAMTADHLPLLLHRAVEVKLVNCTIALVIGILRRGIFIRKYEGRHLYVSTELDIIPTPPPFLHEQIQELVLHLHADSEADPHFFDSFTLPRLTSITLPDYQTIDFPRFHAFLIRSACPIKKLVLHTVELPADELDQILEALPALEDLYLTGRAVRYTIVTILDTVFAPAAHDPTGLRNPALHSVDLEGYWDAYCGWEYLMAGPWFSTKLRRLKLAIISDVTIHAMNELNTILMGKPCIKLIQRLRAEGCQIEVSVEAGTTFVEDLVEASDRGPNTNPT